MKTQLDHVVVLAKTLEQGVQWCEATLGITPAPGGEHAQYGTHNRLFKIATPANPFAYLEINDQMPAIGSVACLIIVAVLADYLPKLSSGIRSIGKVSYFMYFAHFYVLYVCSTALRHFYRSALGPDAAPEPVLYFFILLAAAVSISWGLGQISWRYFESPISRKAQSFHARRSNNRISNTT